MVSGDNKRLQRLILFDTISSVLWFFMDAFWMIKESLLAYLMIGPTITFALITFRYIEKTSPSLAVGVAMNSWLLMNIFWMISDLNDKSDIVFIAKMLFLLGSLSIAFALWRSRSGIEVLNRLRRLRIFWR